MRMTTQEQRGYLAPEIEVNEIEVEQGFAVSDELTRINYGDAGEAGGTIETTTQSGWQYEEVAFYCALMWSDFGFM